jgi:hypothetical protein
MIRLPFWWRLKTPVRPGAVALCAVFALALDLSALAQQQEQPQPPASATPAPAQAPKSAAKPEPSHAGEITEAELKQQLVGKPLFLLGGYLNDSLNFNEHGALIGHSPKGSYTLCGVQIDKVRLTKHKVELEGARYGLHFLGALPYEDPGKSVDRVRITPKKKALKITIDRELVVTAKKEKESGKWLFGKSAKPATPAKPPSAATAPAAPPAAEPSEAEQIKAEIAAAPAAERPADPGSITRTTSPAHASQLLKDALDKIFAQGFDDRLMASLPGFWKLYYQAAAAKADYRPSDPAIHRQNTVDKKARLLSTFEPASNEYAQANAVAGMALYHTVVGADGNAGEIAVGRPIGFGLDENAVDSIRKASFAPAIYDGKPVPVLLDLVVEFRIYSKRTAVAAKPAPADKPADQPAEPSLPGPYSRQEQP